MRNAAPTSSATWTRPPKSASNQDWAATVRACLLAARAAAEIAADAGNRSVPAEIAAAIRADYDRAVTAAFALLPPYPPTRRPGGAAPVAGWPGSATPTNLASRLRNEQDQILACLADTRVPFTNNTAERALRMVKIHDKISGTFRSEDPYRRACPHRTPCKRGWVPTGKPNTTYLHAHEQF